MVKLGGCLHRGGACFGMGHRESVPDISPHSMRHMFHYIYKNCTCSICTLSRRIRTSNGAITTVRMFILPNYRYYRALKGRHLLWKKRTFPWIIVRDRWILPLVRVIGIQKIATSDIIKCITKHMKIEDVYPAPHKMLRIPLYSAVDICIHKYLEAEAMCVCAGVVDIIFFRIPSLNNGLT